MRNVPEPASVEIWLDEPRVARERVDWKSVQVKLAWRKPETEPPLLAPLAELPDPGDLMVLQRVDGGVELVPRAWQKMHFDGRRPSFLEMARQAPGGLGLVPEVAKASEYATELIKQYLPDFDNHTQREQAELLLGTIARLREVKRSLESLARHLEYAVPGRKAVPPIKNPERAIRAAIMSEVYGWSTLRIGKELRLSAPPDSAIKREHQTVRRMLERGRPLLEQCFGAEGWCAKAQRLRTERERWKSMGPKQQFYTLMAEERGTSSEEEESAAVEDGFDGVLDEWVDALEQEDFQRLHRVQLYDSRFSALIRL